MKFIILFLLLIFAVFISWQNDNYSLVDLLSLVSPQLQAASEEEPELPFREQVNMYPPEHWEKFSGTAFWRTLNILNPKLMNRNASQLDTATLAGLSAWSFRFQFSEHWLPSATDPFCGYNCAEYILPKAGYKTSIYFNSRFDFIEQTQDKQFLNTDYFFDKINDSYDKQILTITGSIFPHPNYGVLEAIEKSTRNKKRQQPPGDGRYPSPWVLIQLESWNETELSSLYHQSLILAHQLYNTGRVGHYVNGRKAFQEWIAALEKVDTSMPENDEMLAKACFCNTWTYHCLLEARINAHEYLQKNLDKFGVDKQLIINLAEIYSNEIQILQAGTPNLIPLFKTIDYENWTPQMRQTQINTLKQLLDQEEKANILLSEISK
ncbi:MAG: hypothetical protein K9M99_11470 [Candidatus Cloacimonetes bacterium]|nr:hypothetical protein [Candidatus Cloacimonadota bacterium]